MSLLGWQWRTILPLMGGALVFAVVLYLRQWGRRRVVVAFTPLWRKVVSEADVGTNRRRVLEVVSWLLQALIIALLGLSLGKPLLGHQPGAHAIVLDTSASMLAKRPPRGDRFGAAKQRALEILDRFSDEDRVALVVTGGEARLLFAPTRDHYAIRERLTSLEACACEGRLREGIEIARGLVPDGKSIHVLTDGNEPLDPDADTNVELIDGGNANIGITLLGVRPTPAQPGRYEGTLEVASFAAGRSRSQLRVSLDGQLVDVRDVILQSGERQRIVLPPLNANRGEGVLKAELFNIEIEGALDALAEDNVAYALLSAESERPVRLVAPPNGARFVREALRANPRYRLIEDSSTAVSGAINVVVGLPVPAGPGRYLVLAPAKAGETKIVNALVTDWSVDHPVLKSVSLQGVEIRADSVVAPPSGAQILARFGDIPLLYVREAPDRVELGTTFDVEASNLPLRIAFPVLLYNAIDWMSGVGDDRGEKTPGRRWYIERLGTGDVKKLEVVGPSRHVEASQRGNTIVVDGANEPGLYRITADDETFRVATSLASPLESNLAVREKNLRAPTTLARAADLWSWLIYAALALLAFEWLLYHRRVTS